MSVITALTPGKTAGWTSPEVLAAVTVLDGI